MSKKEKSLNSQLYDALLEISENDHNESNYLLEAAGINPQTMLKNSLDKIDKYQKLLEDKVKNEADDNLFNTVKIKISQLLVQSPEKTSRFLNGYFKKHSLPVQFGTNATFDQEVLMQVKGKLDLNDLSHRLDNKSLKK